MASESVKQALEKLLPLVSEIRAADLPFEHGTKLIGAIMDARAALRELEPTCKQPLQVEQPCECGMRKALELWNGIGFDFWLTDDEWASREPDQDDERKWVNVSAITRNALSHPCPLEQARQEIERLKGRISEVGAMLRDENASIGQIVETMFYAPLREAEAENRSLRQRAESSEAQLAAKAEELRLAWQRAEQAEAERDAAIGSVAECEKWLREISSLVSQHAKRQVLGVPCICDTPELHAANCVQIRRAVIAIEGVVVRAAALAGKEPK